MQIVIILLSSIFILFLPGFIMSLVFFKWNAIDNIERIALSFALSVAIVPLFVFYTNLMGIKITKESVLLEVAGIILVFGGILLLQIWRKKNE
ncbi:MAG TPA: DUF1616 domain-containing protein [Candidatus Eisenbacteria bacterium]|nr:DUF1616 domain-containing protein [Candidatus Eisenbacteria bacterium]